MRLKSFVIKFAASFIANKIRKDKKNALRDQNQLMHLLVSKAKNTLFGTEHSFLEIKSYEDFKRNIPIRDYEKYRQYIDMVKQGKPDILWPGKPKYFAKTSGTTSGVKYIPITKDSMSNHINTARSALMNYFFSKKDADIFDGKVMFLSGSPVLDTKSAIPAGRLSGIVYHEIPFWVKSSQLPSWNTNCIDDWESKVEKIAGETLNEDLRLISGIPPWVHMYFEKLLSLTGKKTVREIFPNLSLFVYGGVNYDPYRAKLTELIGADIDSIETYPASEGFIAFQDDIEDSGLLLNTNSGIFYEFIPLNKISDNDPERLMLAQVKIGIDYALIINSNAGLWAYSIGDCVRFTSLDPYKIIVSGRVDHYISAFGEHVIAKETDEAISEVSKIHNVNIEEFTVAPMVNPPDGSLPYHEWFIEFDKLPLSMLQFAEDLDTEMCRQNIYYKDLIEGKILQKLKIRMMHKSSFREYMKSQGKLGGQNKVPRLNNDRKIADELQSYVII